MERSLLYPSDFLRPMQRLILLHPHAAPSSSEDTPLQVQGTGCQQEGGERANFSNETLVPLDEGLCDIEEFSMVSDPDHQQRDQRESVPDAGINPGFTHYGSARIG